MLTRTVVAAFSSPLTFRVRTILLEYVRRRRLGLTDADKSRSPSRLVRLSREFLAFLPNQIDVFTMARVSQRKTADQTLVRQVVSISRNLLER